MLNFIMMFCYKEYFLILIFYYVILAIKRNQIYDYLLINNFAFYI